MSVGTVCRRTTVAAVGLALFAVAAAGCKDGGGSASRDNAVPVTSAVTPGLAAPAPSAQPTAAAVVAPDNGSEEAGGLPNGGPRCGRGRCRHEGRRRSHDYGKGPLRRRRHPRPSPRARSDRCAGRGGKRRRGRRRRRRWGRRQRPQRRNGGRRWWWRGGRRRDGTVPGRRSRGLHRRSRHPERRHRHDASEEAARHRLRSQPGSHRLAAD